MDKKTRIEDEKREFQALRELSHKVYPFVRAIRKTSGRQMYNKLSLRHWHDLSRAFAILEEIRGEEVNEARTFR